DRRSLFVLGVGRARRLGRRLEQPEAGVADGGWCVGGERGRVLRDVAAEEAGRTALDVATAGYTGDGVAAEGVRARAVAAHDDLGGLRHVDRGGRVDAGAQARGIAYGDVATERDGPGALQRTGRRQHGGIDARPRLAV